LDVAISIKPVQSNWFNILSLGKSTENEDLPSALVRRSVATVILTPSTSDSLITSAIVFITKSWLFFGSHILTNQFF
jgi:hypothetical protein